MNLSEYIHARKIRAADALRLLGAFDCPLRMMFFEALWTKQYYESLISEGQ